MTIQPCGVANLIAKLRAENPGADDDYAKLIAEIDRLSERCRELKTELDEGDYWMERAKQSLANGTCPVCFATDEAGHINGCWIGTLLRDHNAVNQLRDRAVKSVTARSELLDYQWHHYWTARARGGCISADDADPADAIMRAVRENEIHCAEEDHGE